MKRILLLLAFALGAAGQEVEGVGIVFGKDHSFIVQAPPGWVLDNSSGTGQGLHAVFYPSGSSWAASTTVMYANTANKSEGQQTLAELIAYDVAQFERRAPSLSVTHLPELATDGGSKALVRRFQGDEHGNHEAVAYIDEECTIVMLVLSARTKEGFANAYPAFEKLVGSYRFLTANVQIEQ